MELLDNETTIFKTPSHKIKSVRNWVIRNKNKTYQSKNLGKNA